jgi:excinuclease ABC subunit C
LPGEHGLEGLAPHLRELLDRLPTAPGVYLMKDRRGRVCYVGKAVNLRNRVRSYFNRSGDPRAFVPLLGRVLGDIETIVVDNEKEALLLEDTLIKRHHPRFNVELRDDKNYLSLRLDLKASYPRLELVRRIREDGARYFGPFHSARAARATIRLVNRHFQLRTCTDRCMCRRSRPCLQFQIGMCPAPCIQEVPDYPERLRDAILFLEGKTDELTARLRARMEEAAEKMEFEHAAQLRDKLAAIERTLTEQRVVATNFVDQDVFGFYREGDAVTLVVLKVRAGRLTGQQPFAFSGQEFPDEELLSSFLNLYYHRETGVPEEVLLPFPIENADALADLLSEKGRKVSVLVPQRGARMGLVALARKNAAAAFVSRRDPNRELEATLAKLQRRLHLKKLPQRIECFDISTMQGTATVGSRVVFVNGRPARGEYRRFKVQTVSAHPDDYAAMYEVLSRRLRRAREAPPEDPWALPDLLVVDGGKGQLATALMALRDQGLDLAKLDMDVIGLAKEVHDYQPARGAPRVTAANAPEASQGRASLLSEPEGDSPRRHGDTEEAEGSVVPEHSGTAPSTSAEPNPNLPPSDLRASVPPWSSSSRPGKAGRAKDLPDRVYLPRIKDPVPLRPNSAELFLLARVRDESHRFAVTYHKQLRARRTLRSALEDVPGVGPGRRRALLRHFGSLKRVRAATIEELAAAPGMSRPAAEAVVRFFRGLGEAPAAEPAPDPGSTPGSGPGSG